MAKNRGEIYQLVENYESSEESILKIEEISTMESSGSRWFATLSFYNEESKQEVPLKCQLNTGATCNVLSQRDLSIITQDGTPPMETSKAKLKLFNGSFMKPLGLVRLKVVPGGQKEALKFQVVKGPNKPLLCGATCVKLRLLKLGSQAEVLSLDVKNVPLTAQRVLRDYKDVFEGLILAVAALW